MNGDEYFDSEEFRDILSEYEQALRTGMPLFLDTDELCDIADYYQMNDRYEEAEQAVDYALEKDPGATLPLAFKVRDAISREEIEEAAGYLSRIENTDDIEYLYARAELLIAQDRIDEADRMLRDELQQTPPDEYQDYVVDVANIYSDYGVYEKAMEWMLRAKRENNDDFKELMARTLFGIGKYADSERIFNELIDRHPFSKTYWNALANVQFMKEDYGASVSSSEYAIAIDPKDPESLLAKANGLFRLENYEEALEYYRRYSSIIVNDEFGLLHQGTCLVSLGRYEEALERLKEAYNMAPDDSPYLVDICQELAFTYCETGDTKMAMRYLDETDSLDCDHEDILVIKGHVMLVAGNLKKAEHYFKQAIKESEDAQKTLLRILVSLYDNKYVTLCYNLFKRYFEAFGNDGTEGYAYLALCCWDMKYYDEFMVNLKLAVERNKKEAAMALGNLFPEGMEPEEYYEYMKGKLKA